MQAFLYLPGGYPYEGISARAFALLCEGWRYTGTRGYVRPDMYTRTRVVSPGIYSTCIECDVGVLPGLGVVVLDDIIEDVFEAVVGLF